MKPLKQYFKLISYLLSFLILLQGCVIYKKKPSTLEEAVIANTNVKIETTNNHILKFKRIEVKNGKYYGIYKSEKATLKTPIDVELVENVKIKNKTMSTIAPIVGPIVLIAAIPALFPKSNDPLYLDIPIPPL